MQVSLPAELVFELVCADVQSSDSQKVTIVVDGLLEILSDGFGFLRSRIGFEAGADDVYVSPQLAIQSAGRRWIKGQQGHLGTINAILLCFGLKKLLSSPRRRKETRGPILKV